MHILGLTGGVACGKSTVARLLAERGAVVFDADQIGHLVLDEPTVRDELAARFGAGVLDADGRISRPAIAKRVFADSSQAAADRQLLEEIVHPRIGARIEAEIRQLLDDALPAVVIDAPLLIESGWNEVCTLVLLVDAPEEARRRRAASRGWTDEEFTRRQAAQMPIDQKRRWADATIDNSGSLAELETAVDSFWRKFIAAE